MSTTTTTTRPTTLASVGLALGLLLVAGAGFVLVVAIALAADFGDSFNPLGLAATVVAIIGALWGQIVAWQLVLVSIALLRGRARRDEAKVRRAGLHELIYGATLAGLGTVVWMFAPAASELQNGMFVGVHLLGHGALAVHGFALARQP